MAAPPSSLAEPPPARVLVVDDDADVQAAAALLLTRHGFAVEAALSPAEAWSALAAGTPDVVLLDLNFHRGATSGEEGLTLLAELRAQDPDAVVVVATGHSGISVAVAAMRAGATDFVTKPWSNARLVATLQVAAALSRSRREAAALRRENAALRREWGEDARLMGDSPAIVHLRERLRRAAATDAPVLIYGEAGAGKSLMARSLHQQSARAGGPFLPLDLEALAGEAREAALFGGGAGDGAQAGALHDARGGTLVLDEVTALTGPQQARLLAALTQAGPADVRLVSLSRRRREELHGRGGLRADLLYRLNTVEVFAPPLRERGEDALRLAEHFLRLFARRHGRPLRPLAPALADAILADPWPGDVRALRQAMERCIIFAEGERYELRDIPLLGAHGDGAAPLAPNLAQTERALVAAALKRHGFNVSHAARDLGVTRPTLYRRMAKHGL